MHIFSCLALRCGHQPADDLVSLLFRVLQVAYVSSLKFLPVVAENMMPLAVEVIIFCVFITVSSHLIYHYYKNLNHGLSLVMSVLVLLILYCINIYYN